MPISINAGVASAVTRAQRRDDSTTTPRAIAPPGTIPAVTKPAPNPDLKFSSAEAVTSPYSAVRAE